MPAEDAQVLSASSDERQWRTIAALHTRLESELAGALRRSGLSSREYTLLLTLEHRHGESVPDMQHLAAAVGLGPSAVTRLVSRLEGRNLVMRTLGSTDRRRICPVLTPTGRVLMEWLRPLASAALEAGLDGAGRRPALARLVLAVRHAGAPPGAAAG
ncbi:MarR family winged helix-turn-helix transcriptional regulator [Streptomyces sp. NPDC091265]|uniref:MarR family winged helix-turn-helix transcriptional regulator n=1 Tax=unclassified Streptomyces TaxID=2593676 RepID=UPI00344BC1C3